MIFFWVKNREGKVASLAIAAHISTSMTICETPDNVSRWNAASQRWDVGAAGYGAELAKPTLAPPKITCSLLLFLALHKIASSFTLKKRCNLFSNGHVHVFYFSIQLSQPFALSLGVLANERPGTSPYASSPQSFLVSERRVGKQWVNGQINDLAGGAGTEGEHGTPSPLPLQRQISSR